MDEESGGRGLLDTSVVIAIDEVDPGALPGEVAISSVTLAELTAGPAAAADDLERMRRQNLLQRVEASLATLPFDAGCARAYGSVYVATAAAGRKPRGARAADLMIAATALSHEIPLYTLNAKDLEPLRDSIELVDLSR